MRHSSLNNIRPGAGKIRQSQSLSMKGKFPVVPELSFGSDADDAGDDGYEFEGTQADGQEYGVDTASSVSSKGSNSGDQIDPSDYIVEDTSEDARLWRKLLSGIKTTANMPGPWIKRPDLMGTAEQRDIEPINLGSKALPLSPHQHYSAGQQQQRAHQGFPPPLLAPVPAYPPHARPGQGRPQPTYTLEAQIASALPFTPQLPQHNYYNPYAINQNQHRQNHHFQSYAQTPDYTLPSQHPYGMRHVSKSVDFTRQQQRQPTKDRVWDPTSGYPYQSRPSDLPLEHRRGGADLDEVRIMHPKLLQQPLFHNPLVTDSQGREFGGSRWNLWTVCGLGKVEDVFKPTGHIRRRNLEALMRQDPEAIRQLDEIAQAVERRMKSFK
jgi:hypothetical protein